MAGSAEMFRELGEQIQTWMKEYGVPGVAVGIVAKGEEQMAGFGVTSIENPLDVTPDTSFQIGSTTKTVTATAIMRLHEQGKLELNGPVRRYLPDFKLRDEHAAANVTILQTLSHLGGWKGDVVVDTGMGDDAVARYVERLAEAPQVAPLGELWTYNNAGFVVAGRVIEAVTGKTYEAAIKELVLDPLGMGQSTFFPHAVMVRRFAAGHLNQEGGIVIARPWNIPRSAAPAGTLNSTVRDQLRYARFHLGDGRAESGEQVLTAESLRRMQTPVTPAANGQEMAVSWFIQHVGGVRFVAHGGATFGQMSAFWMAPERSFAFTCLTNADRGTLVNNLAAEWVRKHYLGIEPAAPRPFDLPAAALAEYAGDYGLAGDSTVALRLDGNRLTLQVIPGGDFYKTMEVKPETQPPAALTLLGKDRFSVAEGNMKGTVGEFLRGPEGEIRWVRIGVRAYRRR